MNTPLRVLIIEDCEDDATLQIRELRRAGFEVVSRRVETEGDMRQALADAEWDVILSDYTMPGFNGLEALRLARETGRDIPFILLSGTVGEEVAVECMKAGAADYLFKGKLTRLGPAVRRELHEADERRKRRESDDQRRRLEAQLMQAQKLEALGTMASSIAHDFNNILTALTGYVELIRADTTGQAAVQEAVENTLLGIHRATELTRQILSFGRKRPVQRGPMHLGPVVHEALTFLRPLIPSEVRVEVDLPADGPAVMGDTGQVHQAVVNLCTNAIQAMAGSGGVLDVSLKAVCLTADFTTSHPPLQPGPHVRLRVRDTGVGMDAETRARLFEPFFSTRPVGVGTGLGMHVVQGVVKNHEGGIVVTSHPGAGATFDLYFPAIARRSGLRPARPDLHLLFVDDETYLARLGEAMLGKLGYRVTTFTDPKKALEQFLTAPDTYAALITDLNMPGLRGTELAQQIRQVRPDLPVILTTGYSGPHELDRAQGMGFSHILDKPFTVEKLTDLLDEVLAIPVTR